MRTRTRKGTTDWTHEVNDNEVLVHVLGTAKFCATPGDPGVRYTRNGDGYPPSPPEVEFYEESIKALTVKFVNYPELGTIVIPAKSLTAKQLDFLLGSFDSEVEEQRLLEELEDEND